MKQPQSRRAQTRGGSQAASFWIKDQVNPMLLRTFHVSMRTLLNSAAAAVVLVLVGTSSAQTVKNPPLLVPYTIQTVAGTPQFPIGKTAGPVGYSGDGGLATPQVGFCDVDPTAANTVGAGSALCPALSTPYGVAIDSAGNVYFTDQGNDVIRAVNAGTGLLNTIAGAVPKGCSGITCSNKFTGCADGVAALGAPIGGKLQGIAVDAYGNVYFDDGTLDAVWVIYRGGTQVANFIATVDSTTVSSPSQVKVGYAYHIAGLLTSCTGAPGSTDNVLATAGQMRSPAMLSLDSAGNIYIADTGNQTMRVINTQATAQTFFQYTVPPGYIQSIVNCSATLTVGCPAATTSLTFTGINGPANAIVFSSQYKAAEADQYGNVYQLNGTGSGTGAPGIYGPVAYAGGAPLTNLLTVEASMLGAFYGPQSANPSISAGGAPAELPLTYGNSYAVIGDPGTLNNVLNNIVSPYIEQAVATAGTFNVRPSDVTADIFGTLWFMDNHFPYIERIDQFTQTTTLLTGGTNRRAISSVSFSPTQPTAPNLESYLQPATFKNQWFCVYGSSGNPWTQGPRETDPLGDGCPAQISYIGAASTASNIPQVHTDGLGDVFMTDVSNSIVREMLLDNVFPSTPLASSANAAPVTQGIQVHFDVSEPPIPNPGNFKASVGTNVYLAENNTSSGLVPVFSVVSGGGDFTIDTTTPEFAMGTVGPGGYGNNVSQSTWSMWPPSPNPNNIVGLPTCFQQGLSSGAAAGGDTSYDCLVWVKFNPTASGLRTGQLVVTTLSGSVYTFSLSGVGQGGQLAVDGGQQAPYLTTGLGAASAVAVSSTGTVYIADPDNSRIVSCPANAVPCASPKSLVTNPDAGLKNPKGVATDAAGNVYVSDTGNNRVLEVNPQTGVWSTLGNNRFISGGKAPGSTVPQYTFKGPQGLAVDKFGNVYVADTGNGKVVEIPQNTALGGAVALFQYPNGPTFTTPVAVAVDSKGFVYVADTGNPSSNIVRIPPGGGDLETPANNPYSALFTQLQAFSGQAGIVSPVATPNGVAVDGANNVYVSDSTTNTVWVVPAATGSGSVTPYVLNFTGLSAPAGLALDAGGNLYVADAGNKQILFTNRQNPLVSFGTVPQGNGSAQPLCPNTNVSDGLNIGTTSGSCVLTVTNTGNQVVSLTSPVTTVTGVSPVGNTAFGVSNTCGATLSSGATCTISPTFTPVANGPQSENLNVNGGTNSVALVASTNAVGAQPLVNIVLTSSAGLAPAANSTPTITATVTQTHIMNNVPSGTVTFKYAIDVGSYESAACGTGGTATAPLVNGVATFTLPALGQGLQYTLSANYNGDSLNSPTQATPIVLAVPGVSGSYVAASVSYIYGQAVPAITGTTPTLPSGVTAKFVPGGLYPPSLVQATSTSAVANSPYPIQVQFTGTNACSFGFPAVLTSGGQPAVVTENPAPLTVVIPAYSTVYGAEAFNFASGMQITGAVGTDQFSAVFTPPDSSVLDVKPAAPATNPYPVIATLTGKKAGNYTIKYTNGTDTVTAAPAGTTVTQSATSVLLASQNTPTFALLTSTLVNNGKGTPTGSITVTDNFVPITGSVFGPPCSTTVTANCTQNQVLPACSTTVTVNCVTITMPLTVTGATFTLPAPVLTAASGAPVTLVGTHNLVFTYSGDAGTNGDGLGDFQCSVAGGAATSSCPTTQATPFSLIVDYPDINLTSTTGPLIIVPGVAPSGLGLPSAPGQNSSYPETAAISINPVLGFKGTVTLGCTTQNPSYVNCSMTPPTFTISATTSSTAILSVSTPATLPIGFFGTTSAQLRTSAGKTALAFLPLGVLAFCFRRRKRLSQTLLALMVLCGMSAGMSGCSGGNQAVFYTPVPAGPQSVTVTATYTSTGTPLFCGAAPSCTVTRSFVVPLNIE